MKFQWLLILGLIFALIIAVFAVINVDPVQVNLLFDMVQIPLILLILGCALVGGLIVGFYGIYRQYRLQRQIKMLQAQVAELNAGSVTGDRTSMNDVNFDAMHDTTETASSSHFSERKL
ncbi:LapA family protein [Paenibacillus wulumuqiensis]|uniref:LapA family protein n=1 Tax=Paenibacillus wulumuqiensis TaxID=1567107 RepID=UPI000619C24F|nr:lipopolysaccharide assembly protein LapA domain-containing protein [Paenibacillus wulumuqiensis]